MCVTSALMAVVLFGSIGIVAAKAIGIGGDRKFGLGRWLMAPAIGVSLFTPLAFFCFSIAGFSLLKLLALWFAFIAITGTIALYIPHLSVSLLFPEIKAKHAIALILLAAVWGVLPTVLISPFTKAGGLYTNTPLADHVKIAFTDAIVREGMPLKNPFYAPAGKRILLSYSYNFYVAGAMVQRMTHSNGWQTEVAMTWFTGFATVLFLASIASRLANGAAGGYWLVFVSAVGFASYQVWPMIFGPSSNLFFGVLEHGLETLIIQLAWAPQHTIAALGITVMLWLASAALAEQTIHKRWIITIALCTAGGFEASSWVGGIALAAAVPILILGAAALRLPKKNYTTFAISIACAVVICVVLIIPLLRTYLVGTPQSEKNGSIGLGIFPTTVLFEHLHLTGILASLVQIIFFWFHLLPLCFGVIYLVGLPAMIYLIPRSRGERTFRAVALSATLGFLLVTLFIKSTIRANDLGWRAVNVSVMLLSLFAAVAIADMTNRALAGSERYRGRWIPRRIVSLPLALLMLLIGVLAIGLWVTRPPAINTALTPAQAELYHAYAEQLPAWQAVRKFTKPTDLVQANPDAFAHLPPWPTSLPYHLFADRSAAWSCDGTGRTYAFRYSWQDNRKQGALITSVFSAHPKRSAISQLRSRLKVKAILVTPADRVWNSHAIEDSGLYRIAAQTADYKVYVAAKKPQQK